MTTDERGPEHGEPGHSCTSFGCVTLTYTGTGNRTDTRDETLKAAQKWALVKFVVAMEERAAKDRAEACAENGWRMSSAHDLYDDVLVTLNDLARGHLDPHVYLDREREIALRGDGG